MGLPRRTPPPLTVTKCAQWMTLRATAVDAALARDRDDRRTRRFFERAKLPDEVYLPSVLHDTPGLRIGHAETSAQIFRPGQGRPEWLDARVLDTLARRSPAPFARKLPPDVHPDVLRAADSLAERSPAQVRADAVEPGRRTDAHEWLPRVRAQVISP
ncbi:hypothetical protein KILIM_099_00020 [Kineosphaera limosa NBRC 100340]|uniref:Uncharacterized protein n=1 Tax=Kineosphaera limosa NBRC 100340 TaxID=1184609 RepID=K6VPD1_9MICO|nr:hypothetical protein KILIM_099_00020 [Kineosphaera limosa NBRC 100340]